MNGGTKTSNLIIEPHIIRSFCRNYPRWKKLGKKLSSKQEKEFMEFLFRMDLRRIIEKKVGNALAIWNFSIRNGIRWRKMIFQEFYFLHNPLGYNKVKGKQSQSRVPCLPAWACGFFAQSCVKTSINLLEIGTDEQLITFLRMPILKGVRAEEGQLLSHSENYSELQENSDHFEK